MSNKFGIDVFLLYICVVIKNDVMKRLFTKSLFKLATECPTKPFYYKRRKDYGNANIDNEFMLALAEGGFQVGELAKCYYPDGVDVDTLDYDEALRITNELLERENVVIFEGAVQYRNCFVRVDIIVKRGNHIELIEVKSKSYTPNVFNENNPYSKDSIQKYWQHGNNIFEDEADILYAKCYDIRSEWKPYIYDVTFQHYVMVNAFPQYEIIPYLMMADKSKVATVNGLNQYFQIFEKENGRKGVKIVGDTSNLGGRILSKMEVQKYFSFVYSNFTKEGFAETVENWSNAYVNDIKIEGEACDKCFKCQFKYKGEDKKSGFQECFNSFFEGEIDYSKPMIDEIWNYRYKSTLLQGGKLYLDQVEESYIGSDTPTKQRQLLQVVKSLEESNEPYIHKGILRKYADSFVYPLNFIDFETSMVAIPFHKGRKPYEQVAFQFSHHIMYEDGKVEHASEFISWENGDFPNFEFLRSLKKSLEKNNGTIFRYAPHENTVLNQIVGQLRDSNEPDAQELIDFVHTITYRWEFVKDDDGNVQVSNRTGKPLRTRIYGDRNMIDMCVMVKEAFWGKEMKGSNSIKVVLPAVLNASKLIQEKYSKPIYGKGKKINSLNFDEMTWVQFDENGKVINPYKLLNSWINNGASAMSGYCMLQWTNVSKEQKQDIKNGLLRYCELDTLAMVMIMEYWLDNQLKDPIYYSFDGGIDCIELD